MLRLFITSLLSCFFSSTVSASETFFCLSRWAVFPPTGEMEFDKLVSAPLTKGGAHLVPLDSVFTKPPFYPVFSVLPIKGYSIEAFAVPQGKYKMSVSLNTPGGSQISAVSKSGNEKRVILSLFNHSSADYNPQFIPLDIEVECWIE